MSEDLIKREDAIKAIFSKPACHGSDGSWYHSDDIRDALEKAPSADRPQGEWINIYQLSTDGHMTAQCKNCREKIIFWDKAPNFCQNCGERMKGADDES